MVRRGTTIVRRRIVANTMGVEHIFGQGRAKGRFHYQECKRLIELFLELKRERAWRIFCPCGSIHGSCPQVVIAVSAEPECENAANGALLWHLSRVMHDIDIHCKQREYASKLRAQPFAKPSRILDGLLSCMSFGVHLVYRERLHRAHPASHASLADFRAFLQEVLVEWSGKALAIQLHPRSSLSFFCRCKSTRTFAPL